MENREMTTKKIELREAEDGKRFLTGYAVVWEKKSNVLGYYRKFRERFKKGAFEESLKQDEQHFLFSHDTRMVLGRTKYKTLTLEEDSIGLRFELELPDTTLGDDTYKSVQRGDLDGISFGFQKIVDEYEDFEDDVTLRTVTKAKLIEVSLVAFPAYPDSTVSARGYDPYKDYLNETEKDLEVKRKKLKIKILL